MKRIATVALSVILLIGMIIVTPAAAAGCYQSGCNGQDPQVTRCVDDARNLASFRYTGGNPYLQGALLELRQSPACDAAWVRVTDGDCFGEWRPCGAVLEVQGGTAQTTEPKPGQRWTAMWSFRNYVRGCFTNPNYVTGGYVTDQCTAWR
ncbi:DUF2690 domain-containing protein [Actinosynnema sp. NPDC023658]|uniref:DUF2690 domain-containing protein n=1 Tax=Actinosynnema sp. NPDC023658 TaxID=3155465 RepID=UPI0033E8FB4D